MDNPSPDKLHQCVAALTIMSKASIKYKDGWIPWSLEFPRDKPAPLVLFSGGRYAFEHGYIVKRAIPHFYISYKITLMGMWLLHINKVETIEKPI